MSDYTGEILTLVVSLPVGYASKSVQDWQAGRRTQRAREQERRRDDRQRYYLPLTGAARDLGIRLSRLSNIYGGQQAEVFSPGSLSADFRELYLLSPGPINDLGRADPNEARRDERMVQQLRTRMCRELNFATSSLYLTARYIAFSELTRRHLDGARHGLAEQEAADLRKCIASVSSALQGGTGAGLPVEQQESIGEMMCLDDEHVITQFEFRKRLLDLPGWEQFTALLTFYLTQDSEDVSRPFALSFGAKVGHEVRQSIQQLGALVERFERHGLG